MLEINATNGTCGGVFRIGRDRDRSLSGCLLWSLKTVSDLYLVVDVVVHFYSYFGHLVVEPTDSDIVRMILVDIADHNSGQTDNFAAVGSGSRAAVKLP